MVCSFQDGLDGAEDVAEAASGALEEEEGEEDDAVDADEEKENNNFMQSVQTKLKILLAVYQIQNALPWTLPYISYPDAFDTVIAWMSGIELDFVRIVPICVEIKRDVVSVAASARWRTCQISAPPRTCGDARGRSSAARARSPRYRGSACCTVARRFPRFEACRRPPRPSSVRFSSCRASS